MKIRRRSISGVLVLGACLLLSTRLAAEPATQPTSVPSVESRVAALLKQLESESYQDREAAIDVGHHLPAEALPLLKEAGKRPDLSPDVRSQLAIIVKFLEPAVVKQGKRQVYLTFFRHHLIDEYDRVATKNPAWDDTAHKLLDASAELFADEMSGRDNDSNILSHASALFKAKCDDPLIMFLGLRVGMFPTTKKIEAMRTAMLASKYSAFNKFSMLAWIARNAVRDNMKPGQRNGQSTEFLKQALELLPLELAEEPGIPSNVVLQQVVGLSSTGEAARLERSAVWQMIDQTLAKSMPEESVVRLNLKGQFLIQYAWDARGGGWANTVTENGWKLFSERLADADKTLSRCYELYPDDPNAPTSMLTVELGQGQGRQRMEMWFDRAMKADPGNVEACQIKLQYLMPRWHGSIEEQLRFGRQCLAGGQFDSRVPLVVVDVHAMIATPGPWASEVPSPYYAQDDVWQDISAAYEGYLAQVPEAWHSRMRYARYAWLAGKREKSVELHEALLAGPPKFREEALGRVIKAELALRPTGKPALDPTVTVIARAKKNTDDFKRITVDAYDKVGKKNPKWDEPARAALLAAAKDWGNDPDRNFSEHDVMLDSARQAIDAGCDDPLVRYVYSSSVDAYVHPSNADDPAVEPTSFNDAVALGASQYPAFVRLKAITETTSVKVWRKFSGEPERAAVRAALDAGMGLLTQAATDKSVSSRLLQRQVSELLRSQYALGDEAETLVARAHGLLEAGHFDPSAIKCIDLLMQGEIVSAVGAMTVPPNRRRAKMARPAKPTTTKQSWIDSFALQQQWEPLWQEDPTDPYPPQMILAFNRRGQNDQSWAEFWFHEAVRIDPGNYETAIAHLDALQWANASGDDVQAFAEQCGAMGNYRSQIPFVLITHLDRMAHYMSEQEGNSLNDQFGDEEVWSQIAQVYEGYFAHFPLDSDRRSEYASYACRAGRWAVASEQFTVLGAHVRPKAFGTQTRLDACRQHAADLKSKGFLPATQPAAP